MKKIDTIVLKINCLWRDQKDNIDNTVTGTGCKKRYLFSRVSIICFFSFVVTFAWAQNDTFKDLVQDYQYNKIVDLLDDVIQITKFPEIKNPFSLEPVEIVNSESLQNLKKISDIFYEIQSGFFITKPITLKYCKGDCGFLAEYSLQEIYFSMDLVEKILNNKKFKNPYDVLKYISAHELSHYIHEISTQLPYSKKPGFSIHSNISTYQDTVQNFINSLDYSERSKVVAGKSQLFNDFIKDYSVKGLRSHAEVDMIAVIKLIQIGFSNWQDIYAFIDEEINHEKSLNSSGSELIILDFQNRKRTIQQVLREFKDSPLKPE